MRYLVLIALILSSTAFARPRLYFDMDMSKSFAPLTLYKDEKPIQSSWGVFKLKETVKNYPKALDHIRTYERLTKKGQIWMVASLAVLVGGMFSDDESFYSVIALGGLGTSYYYLHKGRGHLAQAMNIYNGDDQWQRDKKVSMSYKIKF
jgi:hypothetical protein